MAIPKPDSSGGHESVADHAERAEHPEPASPERLAKWRQDQRAEEADLKEYLKSSDSEELWDRFRLTPPEDLAGKAEALSDDELKALQGAFELSSEANFTLQRIAENPLRRANKDIPPRLPEGEGIELNGKEMQVVGFEAARGNYILRDAEGNQTRVNRFQVESGVDQDLIQLKEGDVLGGRVMRRVENAPEGPVAIFERETDDKVETEAVPYLQALEEMRVEIAKAAERVPGVEAMRETVKEQMANKRDIGRMVLERAELQDQQKSAEGAEQAKKEAEARATAIVEEQADPAEERRARLAKRMGIGQSRGRFRSGGR